MIKTINRESQEKVIVPGARLYSDYWGLYLIKSIVGECIYYVFLLNEATEEAILRLIKFKAEIRLFLVY